MQTAEFCLNPSKGLKYCLGCLYILALAVLCYLPLYWVLKLIGCGLSTYYLLFIVKLHADKQSRHSIMRVFQTDKGRWGFNTRAEKCYIGQVAVESFKSPYLIILRLRLINQSITSIVIPKDALNDAEFRTLAMRLKSLHS